MTILQLKCHRTIHAAKPWFDQIEPQNHCQMFEVLAAVEQAAWRTYWLWAIRKLFVGVSLPRYRVFSIWNGSRLILLAPLRIFGREARMFDGEARLAYTDFIWGKSATDRNERTEAFQLLLQELRRIGIEQLSLSQLAPDCETLNLLRPYNPEIAESVVCVHISLLGRGDMQSYFSSLTRRARSTIYTAYSRVRTDGRSYSFSEEPLDMRTSDRYFMRRMHTTFGWAWNWKQRLVQIWACYKDVLFRKPVSHCFVLRIDGKIAAFVHGLIVPARKSFEMLRIAMDDELRRYSPGKILLVEVMRHFLANGDINLFDLTRGGEQYKFSMGGEATKMVSAKINLKEG